MEPAAAFQLAVSLPVVSQPAALQQLARPLLENTETVQAA